ncbi:MAG TPA: hypothetical protein VHX64_05575 [Caulobacteraceae bacterium]|nr:hypothetical protein [Caulobacteraceae bacterium]
MFGHPRQIQPVSNRKATLGPLLILCLFILAGLVWQVFGGAVMRSAQPPAHRTTSSL